MTPILAALVLLAAPQPQSAPADTLRAHAAPGLFRTSDACIACHDGVVAPSGEDVSIGSSWRASMMANSARDPYWQAAVRREVMDHPGAAAAIEDECTKCHMPMARYEARVAGAAGSVFAHLPPGRGDERLDALAADGVSCAACHQITAEGLGTEASFTGGFRVDESVTDGRPAFGPFEVDAGRARVMRSATEGMVPTRGDHLRSSEVCATCHTLYTHALDDGGRRVGTLPEQTPYLEWRASDHPGRSTCQDCHMPAVAEPVPVTGVLGRPRSDVSRHVFLGGNFFMLRMLNRYRDELGVRALPGELEAAALRTLDHLGTASAEIAVVDVARDGNRLGFEITVANRAGHKLPTAYPSRRAWLHVTVTDRDGRVVFESGALRGDGSIAGNDNDVDASTFEPHHAVVERPDQVQVYEAIMENALGGVTTGLLSAVRFVKDNRLLPTGFRKEAADPDIAVRGSAAEDGDFGDGGDRVRYLVPLGEALGPFTIEAVLRYQPVAFRWAENLAAYDAFETHRFVTWYREMAGGSAAVLARAVAAGG